MIQNIVRWNHTLWASNFDLESTLYIIVSKGWNTSHSLEEQSNKEFTSGRRRRCQPWEACTLATPQRTTHTPIGAGMAGAPRRCCDHCSNDKRWRSSHLHLHSQHRSRCWHIWVMNYIECKPRPDRLYFLCKAQTKHLVLRKIQRLHNPWERKNVIIKVVDGSNRIRIS
jgi:hypothetical protein